LIFRWGQCPCGMGRMPARLLAWVLTAVQRGAKIVR
jgi:hypothetical protein